MIIMVVVMMMFDLANHCINKVSYQIGAFG